MFVAAMVCLWQLAMRERERGGGNCSRRARKKQQSGSIEFPSVCLSGRVLHSPGRDGAHTHGTTESCVVGVLLTGSALIGGARVRERCVIHGGHLTCSDLSLDFGFDFVPVVATEWVVVIFELVVFVVLDLGLVFGLGFDSSFSHCATS